MSDDIVILTPEQAVAMLPDGDDIHTFRNGHGMLIGADWGRDDIIEQFHKCEVQLSGEQATAMGHGIVFKDGHGYVFVETKQE